MEKNDADALVALRRRYAKAVNELVAAAVIIIMMDNRCRGLGRQLSLEINE